MKEKKTSKTFKTRSGIEIKESYWPGDIKKPVGSDSDSKKTLGEAGSAPYIRGVQKDMYRGRHWTMRQYAGFGTAEESNTRYHYLLSQGTTGLSVAFDLPTQLGYDPDHVRAKGEVGRVGVSISTIEDMRSLFQGIDQSKVSTSMTINATASTLLAFYAAVAEEQGAAVSDLRGTVQNDTLKEYIARGNYIYPPEGALRITTDMFEWCTKNAPKWNPISISGYHIREAGSTAPQELAFTFADAIAYVDAAVKKGVDVDEFASQLSFFFNVHSDFFEEIAKFRAARKIWHDIMTKRFHAKDPKSARLRFHSQTAGSTLTAQSPENNIVRVTLQALASVLGGTQSLHTNSMDEALALPTESSARLALRTQQVIAYESGVTNTVDPLAGSYFIESLTQTLEAETWKILDEIDRRGGTIACIESGYIQGEVLNSAFHDQKGIDEGTIPIVGVNCFKDSEISDASSKREILKISPELERQAVQKIQAFRQKRNSKNAQVALKKIQDGVKTGENLQGLILNAAKAEATLGEISDALRAQFGLFQEHSGF